MNEESNQIPKTKTPKEQIIELFTGKTVEEIEENNRVVKALLDEMHNVSVGDIFTDLDGVYRVLEVRDNEEFPEDPFIIVETFECCGSGFRARLGADDEGFNFLQAKQYNLQHYKAVK